MLTDWAYQEFSQSKLWDVRCIRTMIQTCTAFAEHPEGVFSVVLKGRRKAVSRILHDKRSTPVNLLESHVKATVERSIRHSLILIASDTTSFNFNSHEACQGLGEIGSKGHKGFQTHSAIAISPEGVPLGLLHQSSWVREASELTAAEKKKLPYEKKESYKWHEALRAVEDALPNTQQALLIQDREGDIFEFISAERKENIHLLIRAAHPRKIVVKKKGQPHTLFDSVASAPVAGCREVQVRARPDQEARKATLTVRFQEVEICAPKNVIVPSVPTVKLWVIRATEETPPPGVKEPIDWVLLSTLPINNYQEASTMIDNYSKRWLIERFHFVLKSGCKFERLQMDKFMTLEKALSLYSIVAWRLLSITYIVRVNPDGWDQEAISDIERTVLERTTRKKIKNIRDALLAIASLAGFVSVPSAPMPGVKVIWRGYCILHSLVVGFRLNQVPDV